MDRWLPVTSGQGSPGLRLQGRPPARAMLGGWLPQKTAWHLHPRPQDSNQPLVLWGPAQDSNQPLVLWGLARGRGSGQWEPRPPSRGGGCGEQV